MLQVKNLTITHRKDLRMILRDFTWALGPGDKAVVIGEEGNGKSTFLKLLFNPELVADYVEYSGEILRDRMKMGYLYQELSPAHKAMSVAQFFQESPLFYDCDWGELARIGARLGLPVELFYSEQPVASLSGGEAVKMQLARILMEQPDVLLLDEPSNDLDIETLEWLENFINTCKMPVLFVSHDETLIERTANVILHFEQLRRKTLPRATVARIPYREYVDRRLANMDHQSQVAKKEREEYARQQERFMRIQQKVEHQQATISRQNPHGGQLLKKKMHAVKAMERRFDRGFETMTEFPDTEDAIALKWPVGVDFPNGKKVLDTCISARRMSDAMGRDFPSDIALSVTGPEKVCIIGKNGVGKTTFLRMIAGELQNQGGIKAAYMPQNYEESLDLLATPVDFLARVGDKADISRVRTFLGSLKYTPEEMSHPAGALSGGQKAKLFFAKMILDGCNVLVLDEPTRNFSPLSGPVIRQLLADYPGAIISVSHDRKYICEVCDKIYRLDEGGLHIQDEK